jgi:hypothetical protein
VSGGGLPQVLVRSRRHGVLHRAWRGQALPARGMHQVRSRRHATLRALRMVEANAASARAASSQPLQAALPTAWRTAEASGATSRAAPRPLEAIRNNIASPMAGAGAACTRAAPSPLKAHATLVMNLQSSILMAQMTRSTQRTQHCQAHGGGKRCQQEGCSKPVARGPGSVYCTLCLQPDDAQDDA